MKRSPSRWVSPAPAPPSPGLNNGTAQIGNLSRDVKEEENPDGKFEVITIALDGIAVIVNPNNPVSDLTKEQIADIFTGKITNWKDLGRRGQDNLCGGPGRDLRHPGRLREHSGNQGKMRL